MAKRPDTLETVVCALELLRRIPRGAKISAVELHRQLQYAGIKRDLRSVQRQLAMLSEHFEIDCDSTDKPYGYSWRAHAAGLAVPDLSAAESLILRLAQEHLKHLLPAALVKSMAGFFSQAQRKLGSDGTAGLEKQWPAKVRVVATSQPLLAPKLHPGVFDAVSDALFKNHWLHLRYQNASGKNSEAKVMPLGLVQQGPRLYLVCRYAGYSDERNLALHRILSAEVSVHGFTRPGDFDLKRYDDEGRFGFGDGRRIRLSFRIDKDAGLHLIESPLGSDQQVLDLGDGRLRIIATVVDSAMLEWWLRGFGDAVSHVRRNALTQKSPHPASNA